MIAEHRIVPDLERRDLRRIAIAAFERGDGAASVRRSRAQRVERRVVAFGDVAALAGVDRRRFDERLSELARPAPRGRRDAGAMRRAAPAGPARQPSSWRSAAAAARPSRSTARSRGLPRPAVSRASARAKSGMALSANPRPFAPQRVLVKPGDQCEPLLDLALVRQRRGNVGREEPATGGGLAAVDLAEQAAGNAARNRSAKLEAVARRGVDRHVRRARHAPRSVEQDARTLLRRVEIGEQPARRRKLGPRRAADPVERRQAEARLESALPCEAVEPALACRGAQRPARRNRRWSRRATGAQARRRARPSRRRPAQSAPSKCPLRRSPNRHRLGRPPRASSPTRIRAMSPRSACPG